MPIELDSLLFWCGLGLLCVGLFVFLTGKKASDETKKESNRFEAFGIKIDVNNPSLILIMLGVVMMLAPKFMPQEVKQAAQADTPESKSVATASSEAPASALSQAAPAGEITPPPPLDPLLEPLSDEAETPPSPALTAAAPPAFPAPLPAAETSRSTASPSPREEPATPPTTTSISSKPAPTPAPVATKPLATEKPAMPPPPAPALLVVAVAADADKRAGITSSAETFAQQAAGLIVERTGEIFDDRYEVVSRQSADLRAQLKAETQDYAQLCAQYKAQVLVLGDLRISKAWSTIDSAYWPDYHLRLHHCDTQRSRQEVFRHLNPSNRDNFPFEQSIRHNTMKFLSDSRWVVEG